MLVNLIIILWVVKRNLWWRRNISKEKFLHKRQAVFHGTPNNIFFIGVNKYRVVILFVGGKKLDKIVSNKSMPKLYTL